MKKNKIVIEEEKCNHKLGKGCTVRLSRRRCMVCPDKLKGVCTVCGKSINYIKIQDEYVLKEEKKDDEDK